MVHLYLIYIYYTQFLFFLFISCFIFFLYFFFSFLYSLIFFCSSAFFWPDGGKRPHRDLASSAQTPRQAEIPGYQWVQPACCSPA
jgi:hypothetical protein